MRNNYEDILARVNLVINAIPFLEKENNHEKINNIKKELLLYLSYTEEAIKSLSVIEIPVIPNQEIEINQKKLDKLLEYKKLYLINKDFYESLGINKLLYRMDNSNILEIFNNAVIDLLEILKSINITVMKEDFNYTEYVNKYMAALLDNKDNNDYKLVMKNVFDGIYWEEHEILDNVSINIKQIIANHEKQIKENTEKKLIEFVTLNNINTETAFIEIKELKNLIQDLKNSDPYYVKDLFINDKVDPYKYLPESEYIKKIINYFNPNYDKLNLDSKKEFLNNAYSFKYNLDEYKEFMKYQFLITEVKELLQNKLSKKDVYPEIVKKLNNLLKERETLRKQYIKLMNSKEIILSKKANTYVTEKKKIDKVSKLDLKLKALKEKLNELSDNIKDLQKEKIKNRFEDDLLEAIHEDIKLYDIFKLLCENNIILYDLIKKHDSNLQLNDIEKIANEFNTFVYDSKIDIINNIKLFEFEDMNQIIEKKYKLLNLDFHLENLDEVHKNINDLFIFRNVTISKLDLNAIILYLKK